MMTAIMAMIITVVLLVTVLGPTTPIMGVPTETPLPIILRLVPSPGWIFCFPATNRNYG
jgi:hypothetical protein